MIDIVNNICPMNTSVDGDATHSSVNIMDRFYVDLQMVLSIIYVAADE